MTDPIDHEGRTGRVYEPKLVTEEMRKKRSDAMKAFNRKTGKITLHANMLVKRNRPSKAPK